MSKVDVNIVVSAAILAAAAVGLGTYIVSKNMYDSGYSKGYVLGEKAGVKEVGDKNIKPINEAISKAYDWGCAYAFNEALKEEGYNPEDFDTNVSIACEKSKALPYYNMR